jgi:hypothetical protein
MGTKLSSFAVIVGSCLMLVGLGLIPAAIGQNNDEGLRGAAIVSFAFGALICSLGLYLKSRLVKNTGDTLATKPAAKSSRGGCELCGTETPVILCRVHEVHICGDCVARHYDFRSCVYVPSTRRSVPAKASARAAKA